MITRSKAMKLQNATRNIPVVPEVYSKRKARTRPLAGIDSDRRVRPRMENNSCFYAVLHDHDYIESLKCTEKSHQEDNPDGLFIPENNSDSGIVCTTANDDITDQGECDSRNLTRANSLDDFFQNIENDLNTINQMYLNNSLNIASRSTPASIELQSSDIRSTNAVLSPPSLKEKNTVDTSKINSQSSPVGRRNASIITKSLETATRAVDLEDSSPIIESENTNARNTLMKFRPSITSTPSTERNFLATPKIDSSSSIDSSRNEKIVKLEYDICKKVDTVDGPIKETLANVNIKREESPKIKKTHIYDQPCSSTMVDLADYERVSSPVEDDFVSSDSDDSMTDDDLPPDISRLMGNASEMQNIPKMEQSLSGSESEPEEDEEKEYGSEDELFKDFLQAFVGTSFATAQGLHNLKDTLSRCPDEHEFSENPIGLRVPLMLHQKKALKWMLFRENESCPGGILADDMGLGKTLTMIALIVQTLPPVRLESVNVEDSEDSDDEGWNSYSIRNVIEARSNNNENLGGTLVVCPAMLLQQWYNEIFSRTKPRLLRVKVHHENRTRDPKELCCFDIVITTYNIVHHDSYLFNKVHWRRVVLDEAHVIRNPKTNMAQAVCLLRSEKKWAMTGTPVHNKSLDIYSIVKFLECSPWNDLRIWNSVMKGTRGGMQRLKTVLKSLVLRRTKAELQASGEMPPLPAKFVKQIDINLNEQEAEVYKALLIYSKDLFAQFLMQRDRRNGIYRHDLVKYVHRGKGNRSSICNVEDEFPKELFDELNKVLLNTKGDIQQYHILVLLLRLRQICDHPTLISQMIDKEEFEHQGVDEDESNTRRGNIFQKVLLPVKKTTYGITSHEIYHNNPMRSDNPVYKESYESSKIKAILETVREIVPTGDKIIIVSQWTCMLNVIQYHLAEADEVNSEILSGQVIVRNRQDIIDRFNNPKSDLKILLLSLTAGGLGLNLCGGNHLLMIDNHWNPQLEKQAEDRIYRHGQTKEVTVYKFLCSNTIEERVRELQIKKLKLASDILTGIRLTSTRLTLQDLKKLFDMR